MAKVRRRDKGVSASSGGRGMYWPFTHEFWAWLEQQPNSKKNFFLALLTAFALASPSLVKWMWDYMMAPLPRVTLSCEAAAFPLRQKQGERAVYGLELSPGWGNQLQSSVARSVLDDRDSLWPIDTEILNSNTGVVRSGGGFLCFMTNQSQDPLLSVRLALRVTYRKPGAPHRDMIQMMLPHPLEAFQSFSFYLADDTGWNPEVVLPEAIAARIGDSLKAVEIPVQYSNRDPLSLRAFEPIRIRSLPPK